VVDPTVPKGRRHRCIHSRTFVLLVCFGAVPVIGADHQADISSGRDAGATAFGRLRLRCVVHDAVVSAVSSDAAAASTGAAEHLL
jgi:hypothetical protein